MKWRIEYSRDAGKFIDKQDIHTEVKEELKKFLVNNPAAELRGI